MSLSILQPRGPTIPIGKQGQIVGLYLIPEPNNFSLQQISDLTGVPKTTCYGIIEHAKKQSISTGIWDLCDERNLAPSSTSQPGKGEKLNTEEKTQLIEFTLSSATRCRLPYNQIAKAAGVDICANTVQRILAEDNIHRYTPTEKPLLTEDHKKRRLQFCRDNWDRDWSTVVCTDESYFETGALRSRRKMAQL